MYYTQREQESNFEERDYIRWTGWVRILAVQEETSMAEVVQEPADQPYGIRDCAFRDPAGNLIRIQELA